MNKTQKTKLVIITTILIDLIGFGIIIPVMPEFVNHFHVSYTVVTWLVAIYAACSFLSAPFFGTISDKYGRKWVLLVSVIGTAIGWFILAGAKSIIPVFLGRVIDGITAGNIVIAQTILVDIASSEEERISNLGLFWAIFWVGFIIWPAIGSLLINFGLAVPFIVTGALSTLNACFIYFLLPETNKHIDATKKVSWHPFTPIIRAIKNKRLQTWYGAWFLIALGFSAFQATLTLVLQNNFHMNGTVSGYVFSGIGIMIIVNQRLLLKQWWLKYISHQNILLITTFGLVGVYLVLALTTFFWVLLAVILVSAIFQSTFRPVFQNEILDRVNITSRGETNGVLTGLVNIAMTMSAPLAGYLLEQGISPFFLSAICTIGAGMVFTLFLTRQKSKIDSDDIPAVEENNNSVGAIE